MTRIKTYIRAYWRHNSANDPTLILSELDEQRFEKRKVEIFANGKIQRASQTFEEGSTGLGTEPVPLIEEINADPQFQAETIAKSEFEKLWRKNERRIGNPD